MKHLMSFETFEIASFLCVNKKDSISIFEN
jgi:hypothetical protein